MISNNQRNVLEKGAFREYIGRDDQRKRGDRPNYNGTVKIVDSVSGNTVKATDGTIASLTTVRPVDADSENVQIRLRQVGSAHTDNRKTRELQPYADKLAEILAENTNAMEAWQTNTKLRQRAQGFAKALGNDIHPICNIVSTI